MSSDDSDFSLDSESSDPVIATATVPSKVLSTPAAVHQAVIQSGDNEDFDIESIDASSEDNMPLPEQSPPKKTHNSKPQKKSLNLLSPKIGSSLTYDVEALFSPKSLLKPNKPTSSARRSTESKHQTNAYADQLYSKKADVEKKIDKLRQGKEEEEKALCTFKPTVNPHESSKRGFDGFLNDMKGKVQQRDSKVLQLKANIEGLALTEDMTFKPLICEKSAKLVARRSQPAHEGLHSAAKSALKRSIDQHLRSSASSSDAANRPFMPSVHKGSAKTRLSEPVSHELQPKETPTTTQKPAATKASLKPKKSDKVLVDKLTREYNEAFDSLVDSGNSANYLQIRAILQKLNFLTMNPSEAREQIEREQLISFWTELDSDKVGEVPKEKALDLLIKVLDSKSKAAKTYTLMHSNRQDAKRVKPSKGEAAELTPKVTVRAESASDKALSDKLIQEGLEWKKERHSKLLEKELKELSQATFKPSINPERKKKKAEAQPEAGMSRTEFLYQMAKKLKHERNSKVEGYQAEKERIELEACSSLPDLSMTSKSIRLSSIPVAGLEKAVMRLKQGQLGHEWKKLVIEKGLANIKRPQSTPLEAQAKTLEVKASGSPDKPSSPSHTNEKRPALPIQINIKPSNPSATQSTGLLRTQTSTPQRKPMQSSTSPKVASPLRPAFDNSKKSPAKPAKPATLQVKQTSPNQQSKSSVFVGVRATPPPTKETPVEEFNSPITSAVISAPPLESYPESSSSESSKVVEEPMLTITVNLSADESDQLVVHNEADLDRAVEDFVRKHNLPESKRETLTQMVKDYFDDCNPGTDSDEAEAISPGLDHVDEVSEDESGSEKLSTPVGLQYLAVEDDLISANVEAKTSTEEFLQSGRDSDNHVIEEHVEITAVLFEAVEPSVLQDASNSPDNHKEGDTVATISVTTSSVLELQTYDPASAVYQYEEAQDVDMGLNESQEPTEYLSSQIGDEQMSIQGSIFEPNVSAIETRPNETDMSYAEKLFAADFEGEERQSSDLQMSAADEDTESYFQNSEADYAVIIDTQSLDIEASALESLSAIKEIRNSESEGSVPETGEDTQAEGAAKEADDDLGPVFQVHYASDHSDNSEPSSPKEVYVEAGIMPNYLEPVLSIESRSSDDSGPFEERLRDEASPKSSQRAGSSSSSSDHLEAQLEGEVYLAVAEAVTPLLQEALQAEQNSSRSDMIKASITEDDLPVEETKQHISDLLSTESAEFQASVQASIESDKSAQQTYDPLPLHDLISIDSSAHDSNSADAFPDDSKPATQTHSDEALNQVISESAEVLGEVHTSVEASESKEASMQLGASTDLLF